MSKETKLGLYIVAGMVIAIGFLAYGAVVFFTQGIPNLNRLATADRNGRMANANLFVDGPFTKNYAASAALELPPGQRQNDSPSVQIAYWGPFGIVQGGLIRTPSDGFDYGLLLHFRGAVRKRSNTLGT